MSSTMLSRGPRPERKVQGSYVLGVMLLLEHQLWLCWASSLDKVMCCWWVVLAISRIERERGLVRPFGLCDTKKRKTEWKMSAVPSAARREQ
jgi:hypothetical protein